MAVGDKKAVVMQSDRAIANGIATLGADGILALAQRPTVSGIMSDDGSTTLGELLNKKADGGYGFNGDLNYIIYWDDTDGTKFESHVDEVLLKMGKDISKRFKIVDYPVCVVSGNGGYGDVFSCDDKGLNNTCTIVYYAVYGDGLTTMAFKQKQGGVWYPWEYINPPMRLNVEYRTMERYLEKPVYTKRIILDALAIGTEVQSARTNIDGGLFTDVCETLVRHEMFVYPASGGGMFRLPYIQNDGKLKAIGSMNQSNVSAGDTWLYGSIYTFADLSAYKAMVTCWYTKTTD